MRVIQSCMSNGDDPHMLNIRRLRKEKNREVGASRVTVAQKVILKIVIQAITVLDGIAYEVAVVMEDQALKRIVIKR